ncbi:MAG: hypothetical protein JRJ39_09655 [Deltaproteobacteria bacterium]|nr:hypothetical protein [Deltaproteobacteria bacterium]
MYKNIFCILFTLAMILCLALSSHAEMTSADYNMPALVISGAGNHMNSNNHQIESTLGQPSPLIDHGYPASSSSYELYPGFWYTILLQEINAMPWLLLLLLQ